MENTVQSTESSSTSGEDDGVGVVATPMDALGILANEGSPNLSKRPHLSPLLDRLGFSQRAEASYNRLHRNLS